MNPYPKQNQILPESSCLMIGKISGSHRISNAYQYVEEGGKYKVTIYT